MSEKSIILVGGGGHCKSVIDVLSMLDYNILGVLDMKEKLNEKILSDYSVIGTDDDIHLYKNDATFLVTVGFIKDPTLRNKLFTKIKAQGGRLATIISPTAHVSKYAIIGEGSIVMHQAVVNAEATIGANCIINTFANIEHETIIGDNCHISTGTMVNGACTVGNNVFIGSQSVVAHLVQIVDNTIISAGSFVNKDIKDSGIYWGNPIRKIKGI